MTRSESQRGMISFDITTNVTTDEKHLTTRSDWEEIEPENIPEIASAMLALLEIALLNNKNRTWLDHYRQKNEKKLASGAISH